MYRAAYRSLRFSIALAMAVLALGLYVNTIGHGYVMDDAAVITENRLTQKGLAGMSELATSFYWNGYWDINTGLYRPLPMLTHALEWQFFADNPHASHAVNALLYALIGFLLFYFLSELLTEFSIYVPLIATLFFIVHPIHTEVVANIKSRGELLCFLFFVLAARLFIRACDGESRSLLWWSAGAYGLSLCSKESAVLFLPLFPLMLYFFRGQNLLPSFQRAGLLFISLGIFLSMFVAVTQVSDASGSVATYTYQNNVLLGASNALDRTATALTVIVDYGQLLFFPHPLSYDYSYAHITVTTFSDPKAWLGLLLLLGVIAFAVIGTRKRWPEAFAVLYFGATFALASNLLFPIGVTLAERMLFAPSLGASLLVAFLAGRFLVKPQASVNSLTHLFRGAPLLVVASVAIALTGAAKTIARNAHWSSNLELFQTDLQTVPKSSRAHSNYASAHMNAFAMKETNPKQKAKLLDLPIRESLLALEIDSNNTTALHTLAIAYYFTGDYAASRNYAQQCVAHDAKDGQAYAFLGKSLSQLGALPEATAALERALQLNYSDYSLYYFLGGCYFSQGQFSKAATHYEQALDNDPENTEVLNKLASAYGNLGNTTRAMELFQQTIDLNPDDAYAYYGMGLCHQHLGNMAQANFWFERSKALESGSKN